MRETICLQRTATALPGPFRVLVPRSQVQPHLGSPPQPRTQVSFPVQAFQSPPNTGPWADTQTPSPVKPPDSQDAGPLHLFTTQ